MSKSKGVEAELYQEEYLIDTDFHLHIPTEYLFDYIEDDVIEEKLRAWGSPSGSPTMGWSMGYATEIDFSTHERPQGAALDRDEVAEMMGELGLDEVVIVPGTHLPLSDNRFPTITVELVRAYNEYLMDNVVDVDAGIYGSVVFPKDDVDEAVAEIDRLGDREGIVGAQQWYNASTLWGSTEFDPVWDRLTAKELPLMLHIGAPPRARYDLIEDSMRTYVEMMVTNAGHHTIANVTNMIMTGVFDRFPDLEVVVQEGGTNWIPYIANRADEFYQIGPEDLRLTERLREADEMYLERMPSEYLYDNLYVTTQPIAKPRSAKLAKALFDVSHAEEMFMFATDWPHHTLDLPDWLFDENLLDDDLRARIAHGNAQDVLRLP